ncbi:MAG: hypothetical protein IPK26_02125 [Planctomycetes bacterium]|nr:hypothetical protein [Planctomycetota bacterium]
MTILESPAGATAAPWTCLFEPAIAAIGDAVVARSLLRACQALRPRFVAALADEVGVAVEAGSMVVAPAADWCWGAEFRFQDGAIGRVWLDVPAARALVDAVAVASGGFAAPGALTGVELGLLDFLLVQVVAACTRGPAVPPVSIRATLTPEAAGQAGNTVSLALRLAVGARRGWLRLDLPRIEWPASVRLPDHVAGPAHLGLTVVFGRVVLATAELAAVAAGDLLLLPPGGYPLPGTRCRLLTETGWYLADAEVLVDTPRLLRVRCAAMRPDLPELPVEAGKTTVHLTMGHAALGIATMQRWQDGLELEFAKDDGAAGATWPGPRTLRGELVRVEPEVALRILAVEAGQ